MPKLPVIKANRLIKVLKKLGYRESRQRGSHKIFSHPDGRSTSVPVHPGEDLGKGLLRSILNDIDTSVDEFIKLLH